MATDIRVKEIEGIRPGLRKSSLMRQSLRRLMHNKLAVAGFAVVVFMFVLCFIGPFFSPYTDNKINMAFMNKPRA